MESSVLNLAHEKQRRAEAFLKKGQFEEAIECHELITKLLLQAQLQLQENSHLKASLTNLSSDVPRFVTLQSIALQKDYHKRQAQIVRMKQAKFEEYKAKVECQNSEKVSKQSSKTSEKFEPSYFSNKEDETLHQTIFRTIEKQDSLLNLISSEQDESNQLSKDSKNIIEEMRTVNSQLRSFVGDLIGQLELKEQEIKRLKEQLQSSPNPHEETPLDSIHSVHLEPLPPLAPIEMPEFNLNPS